MKSTTFWDIMPCSPLKVNRRFRGTSPPSSGSKNKPHAFTLVSCSAYFSTLKMEAICSSKTSVDFQQTTWCYIPEDSTLLTTALLQEHAISVALKSHVIHHNIFNKLHNIGTWKLLNGSVFDYFSHLEITRFMDWLIWH
jgi:hypothetical protein